jgi:hypothetical protein
VLVATGAHDVMVHAFASYATSQRLPNAKVVLYSDAGHAFLPNADDFGLGGPFLPALTRKELG